MVLSMCQGQLFFRKVTFGGMCFLRVSLVVVLFLEPTWKNHFEGYSYFDPYNRIWTPQHALRNHLLVDSNDTEGLEHIRKVNGETTGIDIGVPKKPLCLCLHGFQTPLIRGPI